jgi:spore coat protein U-like protein
VTDARSRPPRLARPARKLPTVAGPLVALLLALAASLLPATAEAACTPSGVAQINLGSTTSFDARAAQSVAGSGAGGLACTGILGLLNFQYIHVSVDSLEGRLVHESDGGESIPFTLALSPGGVPLEEGTTSPNLAPGGLLSLGGSSGEVLLYVGLGAASNVKAGIYRGTVSLRWHYATCASISALNICIGGWSLSPGVTQSCLLGLCTLSTGSLPGAGTAVLLTITLVVTPDCRFTANDIDFGSAPFADAFGTVTGHIGIMCTKGQTYSVGLGAGNHYSGTRRQMASGAHRLQYDVYRPGGLVWNATDSRFEQATPAPGDIDQAFPYEARIYPDQPTPPVGVYTDTLVVDVEF